MNENTIKVLLVDDDAIDADLTRRTLSAIGQPRFAMEHAASLAESIEKLSQSTFDVVLLDLGLPDCPHGETLARFLKACGDDLSIIAVTGLADEQSALEAIDHGAQDYIVKGDVTADLLSRSIRYAMQRQLLIKQLKTANSQCEQKNVRLAQLCDTAQEFVENVSHEFRTPLTVIREFTSIIRDGLDGPVTDRQAEHLNKVLHRTDDLALMVDDMLDISKLETGLLSVWRKECRARNLIENVVGLLESRAASKGVTLSTAVPDGLPPIFCDEEKACRVIMNLAVNALKFAPEAGNVEVWARYDESRPMIEIGITDNGPGISKENLELIFERFRQVAAGLHSSTKGFGLGLNIAKELVGLNLGQINVRSQPGVGSTFSFTLPVFDPRTVFERFRERLPLVARDTLDVSLLTVDVELDKCEQAAVVDEFLQRSIRSSDLVMPGGKGRWVIAVACSQPDYPHLARRLVTDWTSFARNCPHAKFPPLRIEYRNTWHTTDPCTEAADAFAALCGNNVANPEATPTVLVVDDDREVRLCLSLRLGSAGFQVTSASNGEEGVAAARAHRPDAIVLDVRMPKMDGLSALQELRADQATRHTPIIMLSASIQDQQRALRAGASYFVRKPYEADEVLSAIESAIGEAVQ